MKTVKVYGPGCKRCETTETMVKDAAAKLGVEVATQLVADLLELGVPGIHLYAMNRATSIREIYANLGR